MTEYWVSQPRKFCDFCKSWIADNRSSVQYHENGKKHQLNVEAKLNELRKKGKKDAAAKEEMMASIKQMEKAALKAFEKDLKDNPALALQYAAKTKSKDESQEPAKAEPRSECKRSEVTEKGKWLEEQTPEGYTYYWNDVTTERTWIKPDSFDSGKSQGNSSKNTQSSTTDDVPPATKKKRKTKQDKTRRTVSDGATVKTEDGEEDGPVSTCAPRPQRPSAYGGWSEIEPESAPVDLQLPTSLDAIEETIITNPSEKPKMKFREKKVDTLGSEFVAFKKRKMAASAARSMKQREDNT